MGRTQLEHCHYDKREAQGVGSPQKWNFKSHQNPRCFFVLAQPRKYPNKNGGFMSIPSIQSPAVPLMLIHQHDSCAPGLGGRGGVAHTDNLTQTDTVRVYHTSCPVQRVGLMKRSEGGELLVPHKRKDLFLKISPVCNPSPVYTVAQLLVEWERVIMLYACPILS